MTLGCAAVLILVSAWGYLASGMASATALLPGAFGLGLLACARGVKAGSRLMTIIAAALALIVLLALFTPLQGALGRGDDAAVLRLLIMQAATAVTLAAYLRAVIGARKRKT